MLTVEETRDALRKEGAEDFSHYELTQIRDSVHALAAIFVDSVLYQEATT